MWYFRDRLNYRRESRKENAKKRLEEVLTPIRVEFDKVMTNLRVTGEPLFFWASDYAKDLRNLHENIEKSYSFDILRTRNPELYAGIEGFFTDLLNIDPYERDMGGDIWRTVHDSIHRTDLYEARPGYEREIFNMLFPGLVLGWDENLVMKKHGPKIREIFDIEGRSFDEGPAYLSKAYYIVRELDSVKAYTKYRRFFLRKADAFLKSLSGQMERDKKLIPG
jgi:hypothetical protein